MERRTLYRSRIDRMLAGVCGGLGEYFQLDPTLIRLVFVLLAAFTGVGVLAYIVLWIVVPEEGGQPLYEQWKSEGKSTVPAPDTSSAPQPPAAASTPGPVPVTGSWSSRPDEWLHRDHIRRGGVVPGVVLIVVGALFLVNVILPQLRIDIWKLWPVILIAIGIGIMVRPRRR